jgi:hypothetical protein
MQARYRAGLFWLIALLPLPGSAGVPLPPARPPEFGPPAVSRRPAPPEPAPAPRKADIPARPEQPDDPGCPDRLARLGVEAEPVEPIAEGRCEIRQPMRLSMLPDGVRVDPPATLTCPAIEALARWTLDSVGPAADRELAAPPVSVEIGTSYQCRTRNGDGSGKLSEHAYANAVDVAGFRFMGRPAVTVGRNAPDSPEQRFETEVRTGACVSFGTVLGPGTNAEHADHLHLDALVRRNGFRVCQ